MATHVRGTVLDSRLTDQQRGLVVSHIDLAERIAFWMTLHVGERGEVHADALFGLVKAAGHSRVGTPFAPYARVCIEGQIRNGKRARSGIRGDRKVARPPVVSFDALLVDVAPEWELMRGSDVPSPYQAATNAELWRTVDELTPRQVCVVRLYYLHDLRQEEIATLLGVSQMEVSRLLSKARASLRESLSDGDDYII
jgi:RNA polymerase sigma factor (sigma-70 family)